MKSRAYAAGAAVIGSAAAAYILGGRPRQLGWVATDKEAGATLAGDDLIPAPDLVATRAITVHAPADQIWPWTAQVGQGRGGFYSYDALENLTGCDIRSADRVVPEWQDVKVGTRSSSPRRSGWVSPLWSRAGRWSSAVASRWAQHRRRTTSPGPLPWESSRAGQRACWCASDTRTRGGGLGCSSSPLQRSAS